MIETEAAAVPILSGAGKMLSRYDVVFCDIWGVVHDGRTAYREGCAALRKFRESGGTVILVTNAPRAKPVVKEVLREKDVPDNCWDDIVSSGEISRAHLLAQGYTAVHHIGPDRDLDIFDDLPVARVSMRHAQALLATGLVDELNETGEDYRARLKPAKLRNLALVCANPDLIVDVGGTLLPCAGAIAAVYEKMGGPVFWAGKPHASAYQMAHRAAQRLRGHSVPKDRILAIGDAIRTDIAGASEYGIDSIFVGQGIHREEVMPDGNLDRLAVEQLVLQSPYRPKAAVATLAW